MGPYPFLFLVPFAHFAVSIIYLYPALPHPTYVRFAAYTRLLMILNMNGLVAVGLSY